MAVSAQYAEFVRDVLSEFGPVSIRKMFGGAGVYRDGVMFALIAGDTLYLRGDEASAGAYEAEGKGQFVYQARDRKPVSLPYWEVPERLFDDPAEILPWARRAHEIASTSKARRRK